MTPTPTWLDDALIYEIYPQSFNERRAIVGVEVRDRESDGSIPTAAWFRGKEYRGHRG